MKALMASVRLAPRSGTLPKTKKAAHEAGLEKLANRPNTGRPDHTARRERRTAIEVQASWAFTFSTMLANAAGSWIAMSDRTLRSISIDSFFSPAMNLL